MSSKILETMRFNRSNQHLQANNIFVPEQFRFMKCITTIKSNLYRNKQYSYCIKSITAVRRYLLQLGQSI
jgi:hypothetical protein